MEMKRDTYRLIQIVHHLFQGAHLVYKVYKLYNSYPGRVVEELDETKIIGCCDHFHVASGTGAVDVRHVRLGGPQTLAGGAAHTGPRVPTQTLHFLCLERNALPTWSLEEQLLLGT